MLRKKQSPLDWHVAIVDLRWRRLTAQDNGSAIAGNKHEQPEQEGKA